MKKMIVTCLLFVAATMAMAQEEARYYLPRTVLRFTLLIEKSTYTPGEYQQYAERFLKKNNLGSETLVSYRLLGAQLSTIGMPDSTKSYTTRLDPKRNIHAFNLDENGVLLSINTEPSRMTEPQHFTTAPKKEPLNPHDYMSQEILSAGSMTKMAELTAREIYSIRESRNQLSRGQADFMPQDGEQLRIMLQQLDTQEGALMQLFDGTIVKDTLETVVSYTPEQERSSDLLFRFSQHYGLTDTDDLAGAPYYIYVEDLHSTPTIQVAAEPGKKDKNGDAIHVNLPGKIRVTVVKDETRLLTQELYAGQFGHTELLDENLFNKKLETAVVLNPVTGNLESIKTELLK